MKKKMNPNTKLRLLQGIGGTLTFTPLAVGIGINFNDYIVNTKSAIGLTIGGGMAVLIIALQMLGKAKKVFGNGFIISGIIFALCVFLEPLILNLKFLTGMLFLGEAQYAVFFQSPIKKAKKQVDFSEQAEATSKAMESLVEKLNGRV